MALCFASAHSQNPAPSRRETSQQKYAHPISGNQPPSAEKRGTQESPIFIKEIQPPKSQEETAQEAEDRKEKAANDRKLVAFTRWLVIATLILGAVGLLQLFVFGYQAVQLKKTVKASGEQSGAMERAIIEASRSAKATEEVAGHIGNSVRTATESVAEATRLASAMERIASDIAISAKAGTESVAALKERTARQMRAYLCVDIGLGVPQQRDKNLRFEAKPYLVNTGHTPAYEVSYRANAGILPLPLPDDFSFPLPAEPIGAATIGSQRNANMSAIVDGFCEDADVEKVKNGSAGKAVYSWGIVTYRDVFGETHETKFCQTIFWNPDGTVFGYFFPRHNEAT